MELVERGRLANVTAEIGLGQTGIVDDKTAPRAGKLAGADQVVVGTIFKSDKRWVLNYRFVDSETGLVKETHRVEEADLQDIGRRLAKGG